MYVLISSTQKEPGEFVLIYHHHGLNLHSLALHLIDEHLWEYYVVMGIDLSSPKILG